MSGYDPTTLRSYRLGNGRLLAWSVLVIVAVLAGQALIAGEGTGRWLALTAAAGIACAAWVLGIRPVVRELPTVLEVHNPIRTWTVTWSSITRIDADDVVRIHAGDQIVRCFALPRRDKRPIVSGFVSAFGGRPLPVSDTEPVRSSVTTYDVIEALEDRAHSLRGGNASDAPPSWDVDRAALVVSAVGVLNGVAWLMLILLG
ncbi:hypothetical protein [Longivirga aurantiaca]|uniref:PH domain-containing protein n=1 Tax=Longivirga aurantiaca TaxID=1837743 RepID=A0ABW1SWQ9_9ACTN